MKAGGRGAIDLINMRILSYYNYYQSKWFKKTATTFDFSSYEKRNLENRICIWFKK